MLTNIYCHACCPGQLNLRDLYCIYSVFGVFVSIVQLSCGWRRVDAGCCCNCKSHSRISLLETKPFYVEVEQF